MTLFSLCTNCDGEFHVMFTTSPSASIDEAFLGTVGSGDEVVGSVNFKGVSVFTALELLESE